MNTTGLIETLVIWSGTQKSIDSTQSEKLNLSLIVEIATEPLFISAQNKNINISIDVSEIIYVLFDRQMLVTIFRNLLSNAIKFSYHHGEIVIKAILSDNDFHTVEVSDQGKGMTKSDIRDIKRSNYGKSRPGTDNEPGTGLGMSIIMEFVKLNNAANDINSVPEKGKEIYLMLPKS